MENYKVIVEHCEKCFEKYGDTCKGVDWPNQKDVETRYQVILNIIDYYEMKYGKSDSYRILDLGCGLGHLYEYSKTHVDNIQYTGLDISSVFVAKCREKYPEVEFICKDILRENDLEKYDFIFMNGVFTEKLHMSYENMWNYFVEMLAKAYSHCNKGMAFNVMSKDVDWERDDLFHVPLNQLSAWLTRHLTRNFVIRYDYGLYEYMVYVMKDHKKQE